MHRAGGYGEPVAGEVRLLFALSPTRADALLEQPILHDTIGQNVAELIGVPSSRDRELVDCLLRQRMLAVSIVRRIPKDVLDTL